ncbi:peptidyl-prolyl cis-trans isomerase/rotamase [Trypanosoma cruzi]|uniref:Peptidyl-prolyl cis-trans isomerase n=1 Tax=Trypanosoma cruzi (strain CL Brener) TaxID=353153 RepID=Q4DKA4_TRYCC|nr:peptidyl-prolyl cis-trans isomerase/rotamase, putative [Trypanosoma cruzi]EAN92940.1 peptidyl-prolyl cis-trans isomerase/rotamase, putative [Trypanosoma cruzi]RNC48962.1 peptidyl-prolyl cis-trans isomerase/rotamase [Trypanosoma cruzi]|eukprot:XP_814791.1 peptidyl-prolyl cis-trans isomerase/rotamase [Trypanosoma cruzi strain CL Brener]
MVKGDCIRAAHLLIKFDGSRNCVSHRTGKSTADLTYDAALAELKQWAKRIADGEITFEDAARQRSDCGSYNSGGDLGFFGPGVMMKPFEDAARSLNVGEVSGVVRTESGLHIIKRLA